MAKDHGVLPISREAWTKELSEIVPPKNKTKRVVTDGERDMIKALLESRAGRWTYTDMLEQWKLEHIRVPDWVGPPPHYNTARRIFRRIEKGEE